MVRAAKAMVIAIALVFIFFASFYAVHSVTI
jgi:hypothetical protein